LLTLLFWPAIAFTGANAAAIPTVAVYGDSLSDNGNFYAATGLPPAPYFAGRISNGPVAVEQIASALGATLADFAWAGATTGLGNHLDAGNPLAIDRLPGMRTSFELSRPALPPLLGGLFVIWGGPNDFLSPAPGDAFPAGVIDRAVDNLVFIATELQNMGARRILVPGMPDLGLTPSYSSDPLGASALSRAFNAELISRLPSGVAYFDTAAVLDRVVRDPGAYGFTNVTDPCFNITTFSVCADPGSYLFWDDFHPTAAGHALLAREILRTAVPEPATTIAGVLAVLAIAIRASRARRKSDPL
jgi:phospholipase/lecithinase/hemolysin